jgi:uncharacterized membrane protein YeiH
MLELVTIIAASTSAISGALQAKRKNMDLFGFLLLATVTTIGGGTIRDMILNRQAFWITDYSYFYTILVWSVIIFMFSYDHKDVPTRRYFLVADAFTLALYTYGGCSLTAQLMSDNYLIIIIMGMITGIAGGVIRDILSNEIPICLQKELYATSSLIGGIVFCLLSALNNTVWGPLIATVATVAIIRILSIKLHLHLPGIKQ